MSPAEVSDYEFILLTIFPVGDFFPTALPTQLEVWRNVIVNQSKKGSKKSEV